jgi:hypothetical protein
MPKKIDKETDKLVKENESLKDLIKSSGWQIVRTNFIKKIGELYSINSIDILNTPASDIVQVIGAKKTAADILTKILKDIDGSVDQFDGNRAMMKSVEEDFTVRYEE